MSMRSLQGETSRIEAIEKYGVFATPADPALNDLTRLTAQICNAPVAAVMLVDGDRRVYKSVFGMLLPEHPRGATPCEVTLLGSDLYEIQDAYLDSAYAVTGLSMGGRVFRYYAGVPLTTPSGTNIGSLFVLDAVARRLSASQRDALTILGRQVITRLELTSRVRQMDVATREHQRIDSALTVERNFVSAVLDTVGALVAVFDTAGRIVRFNRACETISEFDSEELVGRYVWERLIPRDDVAEAMREFESIRAGAFPATFENYWLTKGGGLRRIAWSATALLDQQQEVAFIIATGIDVTVQRAAEETLKQSEARYRQLVEGSLGMVCTHDTNGVLLSINRHGAEAIGRTLEDMVGHPVSEFMPAELVKVFEGYLKQIAETGEAQGLLHLRHLNGEVRVIAYRNKLIEMPGHETYVLGFGVDVSEKIRAEDKLRALIRQSNSILESIGDGIYGLDLEGKVTVVNAAAAQMFGYKPEEMLGKDMHTLVHHTRVDGTPYKWEECPIKQSLEQMETMRVSTEVFWRKDGTSFPVDYVARPQIETSLRGETSEAGRLSKSGSRQAAKAVGVVVAFADVTERRALDKMKDEFISTVSHELRTPLTSLRAALGLIQSGTLSSRPEKTKQMLDIAIGNTDRLVRLVNDILDLERISSGKAELHYTTCSMDDLLRGAVVLQQPDAARADIQLTVDADDVNAWADPDRIMQTITNLISNAIKFSPSGSSIALIATKTSEDEARIEVRDTGRGIPEDRLEQIFDRFQQIDASDSRLMGGTGLGLAICKSIVQQHGGKIWATSQPGEGSSFFFTLPTKASGHLR
jgi:two-component system sensor histidine kinase VicK